MSKEKLATVDQILAYQDSVFVHLDPRQIGVVVPERLRKQPQVVLQFGYDMPVPIKDLRIDDAGVFGTLSFKGEPFTCFVPWRVVFAVVGPDAQGRVFPDDVPEEVMTQMDTNTNSQPRQQLRSVPTGSQVQKASGPAEVVDLAAWKRNKGIA